VDAGNERIVYFCRMVPFINIHTHKTDVENISILNITFNGNWPENKYYSCGIHPWDIDKIEMETHLETLKKYCIQNKILAVGEIGLDRAIQTPIETQKEVFIKQLEIANQYNLPIIIHCVKAWSDLLYIRKNTKKSMPWIFHGYTGNLQTANQLINSGCYLSFGSKLLVNQKVQAVFKQIPLHHIFLETDDSDAKIEEIYRKAAELYDICIEELKLNLFQNFIKIFGEQCTKNG